jgi:Memo-like protein
MVPPQAQTIRRSVIAGSWYPGTESGLARAVDGYLAGVDQPPVSGQLLGLISPHAGYAYSGQTAAYAYHQLQGWQIDTVVLLGPSHRAWVGDYAVSAEDAYETPLGLVPLDHDLIAALRNRIALQPVRRDAEHSLEIQLPFLQRQLGEFRLVPIMMNAEEPSAWPRRCGISRRGPSARCSSPAPTCTTSRTMTKWSATTARWSRPLPPTTWKRSRRCSWPPPVLSVAECRS